MITQQTVEVEQRAHYITGLGRAYCTVCKHAREIPAARCLGSVSDHETCDGCGNPLHDSIEIVTGTATIEHVPCKIF